MIMLQDLAKNHGKNNDFWQCFTPTVFLSCYDLHHSRSFHFIFTLWLIFHEVLPSGKLDPAKCLQSQILLQDHREQIRMDGEEGQEIEITLTPIKRRRTVFPHRQQRNSDVTGKVIWRYPRSKERDKKVPRSGVQTKV